MTRVIGLLLLGFALAGCRASAHPEYLRPCTAAPETGAPDGGRGATPCGAPLQCIGTSSGTFCGIPCATDAECTVYAAGATCRVWGCWFQCHSDGDCPLGMLCTGTFSPGTCG